MNHTFVSGANNIACRVCGWTEDAHGNEVQCECCPNIGPIEIIDDMRMCSQCQARDVEIKAELAAAPQVDTTPRDRISQLTNSLGKEIALESREYFIKEVTSIVEIEKQVAESGIENPAFEVARIVESRIGSWRATLFELKSLEHDLKVKTISDQKYLNQIVPQLRAEEREQFKSYDISYKPNEVVATVKTSKPRQSASDKALESYAKMLGITVEQAKKAMASAITNATGALCTCAATPGVCKVHP